MLCWLVRLVDPILDCCFARATGAAAEAAAAAAVAVEAFIGRSHVAKDKQTEKKSNEREKENKPKFLTVIRAFCLHRDHKTADHNIYHRSQE